MLNGICQELRGIKSLEVQTFFKVKHLRKSLHLKGFDLVQTIFRVQNLRKSLYLKGFDSSRHFVDINLI